MRKQQRSQRIVRDFAYELRGAFPPLRAFDSLENPITHLRSFRREVNDQRGAATKDMLRRVLRLRHYHRLRQRNDDLRNASAIRRDSQCRSQLMYLEGRRGIYTKAFGELRSRLECPFQRGVESLPLIVGLVEQLFAVSQVDALVCILLELR